MQLGKVIHLNARQRIGNDPARTLHPPNPLLHRLIIHGEQLAGGLAELILRQEAVPCR